MHQLLSLRLSSSFLSPALVVAAVSLLGVLPMLAACGSPGDGGVGAGDATPTTSTGEPKPTTTGTPDNGGAASYPKLGSAPDMSWIAGQVVFTQIQSGCVFVRTVPVSDTGAATPTQDGGSGSGSAGGQPTPMVGTAVAFDTSPPLGEITPITPPGEVSQGQPGVYSPNGPGWDESKVQDGDYVVLFGHPARPGEPREMCPGGTPYIVDSMMLNK